MAEGGSFALVRLLNDGECLIAIEGRPAYPRRVSSFGGLLEQRAGDLALARRPVLVKR